jgi:acetylornithine deacetylase/succinyl-diaminopimelate desuccinylase-like protein
MMEIPKQALDEAVELARSLVRIRSTNPPGDEEGIARYIKDYLIVGGLEAELVPTRARKELVGRPAPRPGVGEPRPLRPPRYP